MTDDILDPRIHPVRPDLAAHAYRGRYQARAYAEGEIYTVNQGVANMRGRPDNSASLASQLLFGEIFDVYEIADGWAWGQARRDGYVGYVAAEALTKGCRQPSHYLGLPASHIYPEASLKSPPLTPIYMTTELTLSGGPEVKGFKELAGGGWVYARHLAPLGQRQPDFISAAEKFIGCPYLWGGKTAAGLDCSALVQLALYQAGYKAPRDSDLQLKAFGPALPPESPLMRGDIVFFPGHVGFMMDGKNILHANATHMAVTIDPLAEVIAIIGKSARPAYLGACRLNPAP